MKYFIALKWHDAEKMALRSVHLDMRHRLVPIVETRRQVTSTHDFYGELDEVWYDQDIIIDPTAGGGLLNKDSLSIIDDGLQRIETNNNSKVQFAIWGNAIEDLPGATFTRLKALPQKFCVRLSTSHTNLKQDLDNLEQSYSRFGIFPRDITLIVDFNNHLNVSADAVDKIGRLLISDFVRKHKTRVLLSGAFGTCEKGYKKMYRRDLDLWLGLMDRFDSFDLMFGDYGCLRPNWSKQTDKEQGGGPPAITRYSYDDHWVAWNPQGGATSSPLMAAKHIVSSWGIQKTCGCWACSEFLNRATKLQNKGSYQELLKLGMIHHIHYTITHNLELDF